MPDSPTPVVARRLAAVSAATTVSALPAFLIGGQGVQLREELGFDLFALGLVVALAWAAASVASAMLGRLTERLGGGRSLRIAALASAAVQLLIAVTPSWGLLAIAATLGGLANSLAQPGANLLLTRVIRAELHGIGFAVKQSALPLASMLGGLAVPLVALTIGWR